MYRVTCFRTARIRGAVVAALLFVTMWPLTAHPAGAAATPVAMSIRDMSIVEGDSGQRSAQFALALSQAATTTVTASWATIAGSATAGSDYVTSGGTVTFAPGETGQIVTVPIVGDTVDEPNGGNPESFQVKLTNITAGASFSDDSALGAIEDDDNPTEVALRVGDIALFEGDSGTTTARFVVDLSQPQSTPVSVGVVTNPNTATAGPDFPVFVGNFVFNPGITTLNVNASVNGDTLGEPNETFSLVLQNAVGATVADAVGVATIVDDSDVVSRLSIDDVKVHEPSTGTGTAQFTVHLQPAAADQVSVRFTTANGTAGGGDFSPRAGTLTFLPGATEQTFSVTTQADATVEGPETFTVTLFETQATIADSSAVGTILDASAPTANAGTDRTVTSGTTFGLDGTGSTVPTGPLTFAWAQVSGPPATIDNGDTAQPTVRGLTGTATFRLTVTGSNGLTDTDTVVVTVTNPK